MRFLVFFIALLANIASSKAQAPLSLDVIHAQRANANYEATVLEIIGQVQQGNLNKALVLVDAHLQRFPKSQVGYLMRADILKGMVGIVDGIGDSEVLPKEVNHGLKEQLKNRWVHVQYDDAAVHTSLPASLLDMGNHKTVIVTDMRKGRLYLYENRKGEPHLLRDYYMSVGSEGYGKEVEGDNRTPIGVYHINRYIEGKSLPDLYGKGAFPVNYPNRWDRAKNRTGYGIWLHGTPSDTYARAPWASEGCFVLSNDDLLDIGNYISAEDKTPVILSDTVEWVSREQHAKLRQARLSLLEAWRKDWESLNTSNYLAHYRRDNFNFGAKSFIKWADNKRAVNRSKTFVQVDLEIESLFAYPGVEDMFVVTFLQRYLSNNYQGEARKQQYWQRDKKDGRWRIIYEG